MKEFHMYHFLRYVKLDDFVQVNLVILYLMLIIIKYSDVLEWFEKKKSKNSEILEIYIGNLEWFKMIQEEVRQND
jgi:hypothetical protein